MREFLRNTVLRFPELYDYAPTFGVKFGEPARKIETISCHVAGDDAVIVQDRVVRPDVSSSKAMMRPVAWKYWKYRNIKHSFTYEYPAFFAGGMCSDNYWHMMVEILPLILKHGSDMPIVVSSKFNYYDMFEAFGIPRSRIIKHTGIHFYGCLKLVPTNCMTMQEKVEILRKSCPHINPSIKPTKKIYISRNDSRRRRIVNEKAVIEMLHTMGFQPVEMKHFNFVSQIKLFSSAEQLVIPHGAASANLFATCTGAKVIEIMSLLGWGCSTVRICKARGIDYNVVEARSRWGDMFVDVDVLAQELL